MKEIYFIRHGQTEYNAQRIIQGSGVDSDLNEVGIGQANAFYQKYKDVPFEVVLTSKLKRTHQTVKPFIDAGLREERFAEINEMNWGVHEGKKGSPELRVDYTKMLEEWQKGNYGYKLEQAESANELGARLKKFTAHIKTRPEKTILVCSHGRALRCLMSVLKELEYKEMEQFNHSNTGLWKVFYNSDTDKFELLTNNDTSHLDN